MLEIFQGGVSMGAPRPHQAVFFIFLFLIFFSCGGKGHKGDLGFVDTVEDHAAMDVDAPIDGMPSDGGDILSDSGQLDTNVADDVTDAAGPDAPMDMADASVDIRDASMDMPNEASALKASRITGGAVRAESMSYRIHVGVAIGPLSRGGTLKSSTYRIHIGLVPVLEGQ
jgi:hypothetical protein